MAQIQLGGGNVYLGDLLLNSPKYPAGTAFFYTAIPNLNTTYMDYVKQSMAGFPVMKKEFLDKGVKLTIMPAYEYGNYYYFDKFTANAPAGATIERSTGTTKTTYIYLPKSLVMTNNVLSFTLGSTENTSKTQIIQINFNDLSGLINNGSTPITLVEAY